MKKTPGLFFVTMPSKQDDADEDNDGEICALDADGKPLGTDGGNLEIPMMAKQKNRADRNLQLLMLMVLKNRPKTSWLTCSMKRRNFCLRCGGMRF